MLTECKYTLFSPHPPSSQRDECLQLTRKSQETHRLARSGEAEATFEARDDRNHWNPLHACYSLSKSIPDIEKACYYYYYFFDHAAGVRTCIDWQSLAAMQYGIDFNLVNKSITVLVLTTLPGHRPSSEYAGLPTQIPVSAHKFPSWSG